MGNADVYATMLKWSIRLSFVFAAVLVFIFIINFQVSLMTVAFNDSVLTDILALIQVWLPFNYYILAGWLVTGVTIFLLYRATMLAVTWLNRLIGD